MSSNLSFEHHCSRNVTLVMQRNTEADITVYIFIYSLQGINDFCDRNETLTLKGTRLFFSFVPFSAWSILAYCSGLNQT